MSNESENERYIGDSVYVSFDGYHFKLRTGDVNNQVIFLDPSVMDALIKYRIEILKAISMSNPAG